MADVHTKQQRSYNMSQIKAKDTKPECWYEGFCMAGKSLIIVLCDLKANLSKQFFLTFTKWILIFYPSIS